LLCDKSGTERNIYRFKRKIAEYLKEPIIETNDLEEIFSHLMGRIKNKKIIIVFDEFSYLVEKDNTIPSQFQVIIDDILKQTNNFLILCGSSISMMEKGVLSYKSALYGRKTAHIKLRDIPFHSFNDFFPSNNIEKNIEFNAVLGGVPFYLEKFSDKKNTFDNIKDQIFGKNGQLYEEVDFLLKEELREPDVYKSILSAIASGQTKVVEIANRSGIKVHDMDKYLKVLIRLGIVKKETLITRTKSKKTIYSIDDNFFSFSFVFSEPFRSNLEIGDTKIVEEKLNQDFNAFTGKKFEKFIREEIIQKLDIIQPQKIGRWWGNYRDQEANARRDIEIDVIALNSNTNEILFGECKWIDNVDGKDLLKKLIEKTEYVEWPNKRKNRREYYIIIAKSFKKKSTEKNVFYFDLKDIEKLLR
jgi:AAA+ ATPase superfamily predicted ATPase